MKKQLIWIIQFALLLAFFPAPAFAAPMLQGEDPQAQAEKLFGEGNELRQLGQYQAALVFEPAAKGGLFRQRFAAGIDQLVGNRRIFCPGGDQAP